jgi:hypothetical protein
VSVMIKFYVSHTLCCYVICSVIGAQQMLVIVTKMVGSRDSTVC